MKDTFGGVRAALFSTILLGAACSGNGGEPAGPTGAATDQGTTEPASPVTPVDLASVCPNPIVIQNNWIPQSSEGFFFKLIPVEQAQFEADTGTLTGPSAVDPNVTIELRSGGPAAGFQDVNSLLYANPETLLTTGNMDSMVALSRDFPTTAVFAPYVKHPQALMWATAAFEEEIDSFEDIRATEAPVLVAENHTYGHGLIALGELDEDQVDFSWDFSPARFVADQGRVFQAAFSIVDPYFYENHLEPWGGGDISYLYVVDGGYPNYRVVFARRDTITDEADCLARFVPVLQRAWVDYLNDFAEINVKITDWTTEMNADTIFPPELSDNSIDVIFQDGLVADGPSGYLGEIEQSQVERLVEILLPVFQEQNTEVDPDLTATDLFVNEFLDQSVRAPTG